MGNDCVCHELASSLHGGGGRPPCSGPLTGFCDDGCVRGVLMPGVGADGACDWWPASLAGGRGCVGAPGGQLVLT